MAAAPRPSCSVRASASSTCLRRSSSRVASRSAFFSRVAITRARSRVGIERFEDEILGAELDAADHGLDLVERRDHDDGKIVRASVLLEMLQHLIAVHLRHHDVEQHEIEVAPVERG